ncbi:hypothetical protein KR200_008756 [Drosophila serrata]|nr:hypothetical protein KR200_008756 [Drosophila serrata]
MPFIDDALLWCPDNDGRLVGGLDLATCIADDSTVTGTENINPTIQSAGNPNGNPQQSIGGGGGAGVGAGGGGVGVGVSLGVSLGVGQNGGAVQPCNELSGAAARSVNVVVEPLCGSDSSDELFRSFEGNFEIESLLSDLATVEEENNNNVIGSDDFGSAVVAAADDLLAKENAQLSAQNLVDSVAASLVDATGGAFNGSNSAASAALAAAAAALCGDLINNNNNECSGGAGSGGGGVGSGGGVAGDCGATKLEYALMGGQPLAEEPRFGTSAAANPLLVEKLMSKCLNIEKRLDKLGAKQQQQQQQLHHRLCNIICCSSISRLATCNLQLAAMQ